MTTYDVTERTINYADVESDLVRTFASTAINAKVNTKSYGPGTITEVDGSTFDQIIITVAFAACIKKFKADVALRTVKSMEFEDETLAAEYESLYQDHSDLTHEKNLAEVAARLAAREEAAKQEKLRKAAEKAKQLSVKIIKDFGELASQMKTYKSEESAGFFWGLGWLAKHISTISASMPDYLDSYFIQQFGSDAVHTLVDSTKLTSGGHAMKWNFSFKATVGSKAEIPAMFAQYLNTNGKAFTNTVFLWDLIENHGFKFGKEQDVNAIRSKVPVEFKGAFDEGYNT